MKTLSGCGGHGRTKKEEQDDFLIVLDSPCLLVLIKERLIADNTVTYNELFDVGSEEDFVSADSLNSIPADNVPAGRSSSIPADYVSAGHVLVPADITTVSTVPNRHYLCQTMQNCPYLEKVKEKYEDMGYGRWSTGYRMMIIIFGGMFDGNSQEVGKRCKRKLQLFIPPVSLDEHVCCTKDNKVETLLLQASHWRISYARFSSFMMYARDIWMPSG
ncbi:hypothetical protein Tco_0626488 [Tanacetum coccineum]|uniref:Uncharacterized protein n=1 Tax=Tanacetum coccineum TaxID=301880 RepID=A0ABQ4WJP7_9ASTR